MPYKYFFQGFEGARQVQSMMIDFPELNFILDYKKLGRQEFLTIMAIECRESNIHKPGYWFSILCRPEKGHISRVCESVPPDDLTQKIFVSPESEGFFKYNENQDTTLLDWKDEKVLYWERNGKRIYMPLTV